MNHAILLLGGQLLLLVKKEQSTETIREVLANKNINDLEDVLSTDDARKTFWINIYNAYFQILSHQPLITKPGIFTEKLITLAGHQFSLDDIEHGILRKKRWKYGWGYLPAPYTSLIRRLAVHRRDFRIHFALNCGALSCPPIAFYKPENIEKQLDLATSAFLTTETIVNVSNRSVQVTRLMDWFRADFGGLSGIRKILSQYLKEDFRRYKVKFSDYRWEQKLSNFKGQKA